MNESRLDPILSGLQASESVEIIRSVMQVREILPTLAGADLRRAVEALCALFYIDLSDRPDLEPALEAAEETLVRAGEGVIPILIRLMEGSDIKSHLHLASALGRIGVASLPHLRTLLATAQDSYSRSFALFAIGKIKSPTAHESLPEVVGSLMHPDKEVRDSAARTLGKIVEVVPASTLTERRRREIYDALCRATGDPQPAVRAKSVRSLGKLAAHGYLDDDNRRHLRNLLDRLVTRGEESDWDRAYIVRREALEALEKIPGE